MKLTEFLKYNILYLDGGMGTLLQRQGLLPGELPETWLGDGGGLGWRDYPNLYSSGGGSLFLPSTLYHLLQLLSDSHSAGPDFSLQVPKFLRPGDGTALQECGAKLCQRVAVSLCPAFPPSGPMGLLPVPAVGHYNAGKP